MNYTIVRMGNGARLNYRSCMYLLKGSKQTFKYGLDMKSIQKFSSREEAKSALSNMTINDDYVYTIVNI